MTCDELRAFWLVARREYGQRVKALSFVISTFAAPILFLAAVSIPALLAGPHPSSPTPIVVVCTPPAAAAQVTETFRHWRPANYRAEIVAATSAQERDRLTAMVRKWRIEGFLWLDKEALASGRAVFTSRSGLDSFARESLYSITDRALIRSRLAAKGSEAGEIDRSLQPLVLDSVSVVGTATKSDSALAAIVVTVLIITTLETSLLLYGIIVMRSVLEDKTSRVVEILLCSVTPRALMAGKIFGIGGLGLTQVAIWGTIAAGLIAAVAPMLGGSPAVSGLALGPGPVVLIMLFYILGYLLYSSLYAA
jgi:ABC-2 type transport system permease protein